MTRETSHLQQEQVEMLMQIGAYLRQVREENLLSLEDMATKTLIQSRLLRAIEDGKLHQLPESVYIQGFIRRYADALGLDGAQFADAFPVEGGIRVVPSTWNESPAAQLRPLHLYFAYIALIMTSVSLLSYVVNRSTAPLASTVPRPVLTAAPPSSPAATASPKAASAATGNSPTNSPTNPQKPVQVAVKLTSQSWLQVEIDGKIDFEGVLSEGSERNWAATTQLRMRAGNAGGVMVSYNGGTAKQLGEMGAVEEVVFSKSQDAASLPSAALSVTP